MTLPPSPLSRMTGLIPLTRTTVTADPQAAYRQLRDQWGGPVAPVQLEPGVNAWLVMGYDLVLQVVRQERVFARDPRHWRDYAAGRVAPGSGLGPMMFPRDNAYCSDAAEHRRLRAPIDRAMHGLPLRRTSAQVRQVCTDLIAGFAEHGRADLVADYAAVIPMLAVASLFGLDPACWDELRGCLLALFGSGDGSQAGNRRLEDILAGHLRSPRAAGNLTSVFLDDPGLRGEDEVIQSMVLMLAAGWETTTCWIAATLQLMLTDPRFGGRLRGGRLGLDDALDEVLWRCPPMANMPARFPLRDTEVGGQAVSQGDALVLGLAAAGADPGAHGADWADGDGDTWDEIGNRSHLAWSAGPHACPAQVPARIITSIAVEAALNLLPGIRPAVPAGSTGLIPSPWTRCPDALPVTFAPGPPPGPAGR
jgi:cytochrome P450